MEPELPSELRSIIGDAEWRETFEGLSGVRIFLLQGDDNRYLKVALRGSEHDLLPEKLRLDWLQGKLSVPQVLFFGEDTTYQYLLLTEISGWMAHDEAFKMNMPQLVRLIVAGMRQIHGINVADCPFDQRLDMRIEAARFNLINNLVDEDDFDPERRGRSPQHLYRQVLALRPQSEDLVFTHGDYCLPNIIIDPIKQVINGFIDWGNAGIADRHQDIALAARSLAYNFGAEWVPLLFKEYGADKIDPAKIEYYKLLDEFF